MICYLSLGSNIGDRDYNLRQAVYELQSLDQLTLLKKSSIIQTQPWGKTDQDDFFNCAIEIDWQGDAVSLLENLLNIEIKMGRVREEKWGPRLIDLDILFFGQEIISLPNLVIPHPWLHERDFVLDCLIEICPDLIHPIINKSIKELYQNFHK